MGRPGPDEGRLQHGRDRPQRLALTSFWQCGGHPPARPAHPVTAGQGRGCPTPEPDRGIRAPEAGRARQRLLVFGAAGRAPYLHYGVVDPAGRLVHSIDVPCRGRGLPHDMAFTENYAILNDLPLFWDPSCSRWACVPKFFPDVPTRFAVVRDGARPRTSAGSEGGPPTYVLHWINAYEEGDEIVLDGFFQHNPSRVASPAARRWPRSTATSTWPSSTRAAPVAAEPEDRGDPRGAAVGPRHGVQDGQRPVYGHDYRYAYNATPSRGCSSSTGSSSTTLRTGATSGTPSARVYGSETPFAPRPNATAEDDGYLVTFTTDMVRDRSECLVFDAASITDGPIARCACPSGSPPGRTPAGPRLPRSRELRWLRCGSVGSGSRSQCHRPHPRPARRRVVAADRPVRRRRGPSLPGGWKQHLGISDAVLAARLGALVDAGCWCRCQPSGGRTRIFKRRRDWACGRCCSPSGPGSCTTCPARPTCFARMLHATCAAEFEPVLRCRGCAGATRREEVELALGPRPLRALGAGGLEPASYDRRAAPPLVQACSPDDDPHRRPLVVRDPRRSRPRATRFSDFERMTRCVTHRGRRAAPGVRRPGRAGARRWEGRGESGARPASYLLSARGGLLPRGRDRPRLGERQFPSPDGPAIARRYRPCGKNSVPQGLGLRSCPRNPGGGDYRRPTSRRRRRWRVVVQDVTAAAARYCDGEDHRVMIDAVDHIHGGLADNGVSGADDGPTHSSVPTTSRTRKVIGACPTGRQSRSQQRRHRGGSRRARRPRDRVARPFARLARLASRVRHPVAPTRRPRTGGRRPVTPSAACHQRARSNIENTRHGIPTEGTGSSPSRL